MDEHEHEGAFWTDTEAPSDLGTLYPLYETFDRGQREAYEKNLLSYREFPSFNDLRRPMTFEEFCEWYAQLEDTEREGNVVNWRLGFNEYFQRFMQWMDQTTGEEAPPEEFGIYLS